MRPGNYQRWPEDKKREIIEAVKGKTQIEIRAICESYGVPRNTLDYWLTARLRRKKLMGRPGTLRKFVEKVARQVYREEQGKR